MQTVTTVLKLALTLAVLHAVGRGGLVALTYYQFKDAAQQTAVFGGEADLTVLQNTVMQRALELDVPIQPEQIQVKRLGPRTLIEAAYTQRVEYFPNQFYPIRLAFSVEGFNMKAVH